jgi:hypothetical protein
MVIQNCDSTELPPSHATSAKTAGKFNRKVSYGGALMSVDLSRQAGWAMLFTALNG